MRLFKEGGALLLLLLTLSACEDESSSDAPIDAGQSEQDAAPLEGDAESPEQDTAVPQLDMMLPEQDATTPEQDAMLPEQDAMTPEQDAISSDRELPMEDAGDSNHIDEGMPITDSGSDGAADALIDDAFVPEDDAFVPEDDAFIPEEDAFIPAPGFTEAEVQALLSDRCASCHIGGTSGGLSLDDFVSATINVASSNGMPYITPGDPTQSYLFHKVSGTQAEAGGGGSQMPRGRAPLAAEELEDLRRYIVGLE